MDKKDPMQALESFYRAAEKAEAPAGLDHRKPRTAAGTRKTEFLKFASACAAGIAIACVLAVPTSAEVPALPASVGAGMSLREQLVRSGLNPDEVLGIEERRSQLEGGIRWRV